MAWPSIVLPALGKLKDWYTQLNTYFATCKGLWDAHITGTGDKHAADKIEYIPGGQSIKDKYDNHVSGEEDRHTSSDIANQSSVSGITTSNALDTLKAKDESLQEQINEMSVEGSIDPEVSQAHVSDFKGKTFPTIKERFEEAECGNIGHAYEGKRFTINNPYSHGGSLLLKGQIHCHTTNSDGADTPVALVTAYKNAGYDFINVSDHEYLTPDPGVQDIIYITGVEETQERHIVVLDVETQSLDANAQDIINFHRANRKMTSLAHINWNMDAYLGTHAAQKDEILGYFDFNFIEVWNAVTNSYAEDQVDWALSEGKKVFLVAVDDCHNIANPSNFNKGWIVVNAQSSTKTEILNTLRKGNFYASSGNDIAIDVDGNVITASSSASSNFIFIGRNGRILQSNNGVTSANYTIKGDEMYVRVKSTKVSDSTNAWSQPVFIDCIGDDNRPISDIYSPLHGLYRQAIINGNFDVWQRGTSILNPGNAAYLADRWRISLSSFGLPASIIHSKQALNPGELFGSSNFYRIAVDGPGVMDTGDTYSINQYIEKGAEYLCGLGKKITLSFYARSSISGKKIAVNVEQFSGSDGNAVEFMHGRTFDLTPYWKRYSYTFKTNTLSGKIINTDKPNPIRVKLHLAWGAFVASAQIGIGEVTETFIGAGNIDIAQVQVNAGDQALPFMPKSFDEEFQDCLRFYEKSYDYSIAPGSISQNGQYRVLAATVNSFYDGGKIRYAKKMKTPVITYYSPYTGASNNIFNGTSMSDVAGSSVVNPGENGCYISGPALYVVGNDYRFHFTADAEF